MLMPSSPNGVGGIPAQFMQHHSKHTIVMLSGGVMADDNDDEDDGGNADDDGDVARNSPRCGNADSSSAMFSAFDHPAGHEMLLMRRQTSALGGNEMVALSPTESVERARQTRDAIVFLHHDGTEHRRETTTLV